MSRSKEAARPQLYVAEPPAAYRVLPPLTIDCSVLVAGLFREPAYEALARKAMRGCELHAPELLEYEFVNVAWKKAAAIDEAFARAALDALDSLDVRLHRIDRKASFDLAHRYALTAYDAAYLWLAGEMKTPLATFDRRLAEAGRRHLGGSRN